MVAHGWLRRRRVPGGQRPGERLAKQRREARETRSFEAEYVGGLWHFDFHHESRKIHNAQGEWVRPVLLAILDDRSRLACHAQWYVSETAASLVHGLVQAFLKRGLPRALLTDNGGSDAGRRNHARTVGAATTLRSPGPPFPGRGVVLLQKENAGGATVSTPPYLCSRM
jgi:transposase InsO family protein